jgi:hypothetical protein
MAGGIDSNLLILSFVIDRVAAAAHSLWLTRQNSRELSVLKQLNACRRIRALMAPKVIDRL